MRVPDSKDSPVNSAIQANQDRIRALREQRTEAWGGGYSAVAQKTDADWPKSVEHWKAVLADRKQAAAFVGTRVGGQVSTLLLWQQQMDVKKPENTNVAPVATPKPPVSSSRALAPLSLPIPAKEIQDIGRSLASVMKKLGSIPVQKPSMESVPRASSMVPAIVPAVVPAFRAPEADAPLNHLVFPGEEPMSAGAYPENMPVSSEPLWEPIFPRDIYKPIPLELPPVKPKEQLLLERQIRDKQKPKA